MDLVDNSELVLVYLLFYFEVYLFILRERERDSANGGGAEGERENPKQAPRSAQSSMRGSIPRPWDRDLNPDQALDAQRTEPPTSVKQPLNL